MSNVIVTMSLQVGVALVVEGRHLSWGTSTSLVRGTGLSNATGADPYGHTAYLALKAGDGAPAVAKLIPRGGLHPFLSLATHQQVASVTCDERWSHERLAERCKVSHVICIGLSV